MKTRQHRCCQRGGGHARVRCFAAAAPHPAYDRELHNISLAQPGPALLRSLCGPTRLLTKRWVPPPPTQGTPVCRCPPQEGSTGVQLWVEWWGGDWDGPRSCVRPPLPHLRGDPGIQDPPHQGGDPRDWDHPHLREDPGIQLPHPCDTPSISEGTQVYGPPP